MTITSIYKIQYADFQMSLDVVDEEVLWDILSTMFNKMIKSICF